MTVAAAPCLRLVQLFARNEERGRKVAELATAFADVSLSIFTSLLPALLIALGLWKFERVVIRLFTWFGRIMTALSVLGLLAGLTQSLTG